MKKKNYEQKTKDEKLRIEYEMLSHKHITQTKERKIEAKVLSWTKY